MIEFIILQRTGARDPSSMPDRRAGVTLLRDRVPIQVPIGSRSSLLGITRQSSGKASQAGFSSSPYYLDMLPADAYRLQLSLPVVQGVGDSAIVVNAGYTTVVRAVLSEESG